MVELNEKVKGTPSRAKRVLLQALMGLAVALVGFVAVLMAATTLSGFFGINSLIVLSGSMEPTIHVGDIAMTRNVDPTTVGVGDVVTYRSGKIFVTHRIIRVVDTPQGRQFEVKGDNNPTPDSTLVAEERVVAKFIFDVPKMGYLVNFAHSTNGLTLFVIIPAVILGLMWYRERQGKKARARLQESPDPSSNGEAR
ncbi:MAG: signal peptidase I [Dehalococcoidia bacterium]|nr:signal peptidase I [Dehalococcoidia bacterium]